MLQYKAMKPKSKTKLYKALVKDVYLHGIEGVTTGVIAQEAGVAEGLIFYYFKNKNGMLEQCARIYDHSLMQVFLSLHGEDKSFEQIWDNLFPELIAHPQGAIYYHAYTTYYGFHPLSDETWKKEHLEVAHTLFPEKSYLDDEHLLLFWDYVTHQLFYYVDKIIKGDIIDSPEKREFIKKIVLSAFEKI